MKFVLFQNAGYTEPTPGLLTERGVVSLAGLIERGYTPQLTMQNLIDRFERLAANPGEGRRRCRGRAGNLGAPLLAAAAARARSSAASPITGSTRSARRGRSTCSSRTRRR